MTKIIIFPFFSDISPRFTNLGLSFIHLQPPYPPSVPHPKPQKNLALPHSPRAPREPRAWRT